jgi:hypothetical protein
LDEGTDTGAEAEVVVADSKVGEVSQTQLIAASPEARCEYRAAFARERYH